MTSKAYRGTKLSEAIQMMMWNAPKKYLYRITSKDEARWYADLAWLKDRSWKAAILSATIDADQQEMKHMSAQDRWDHYDHKKKILQWKIWYYETHNFTIYIVPPTVHWAIHSPVIEDVYAIDDDY